MTIAPTLSPNAVRERAHRWGEDVGTSPEIDEILRAVRPLQNLIVNHDLYGRLDRVTHAQVFVEHHVLAVLDFMWLLKRLQQMLTCVDVPWVPVGTAASRRFINEIVVEEESDEFDGVYTSHFEVYLSAMAEVGADVRPIEEFVDRIRQGGEPLASAEAAGLRPGARQFLATTWDLVQNGSPAAVAGAFAFGRENLIPDMFTSLLELAERVPEHCGTIADYLMRHIELDGDHHTPLAFGMIRSICGNSDASWNDSQNAATRALQARLGLWDSCLAAIDALDDGVNDG